jgi:hypothetical protein
MTGVRRTQRGGVSSAKAPLRRGADDWLFMMRDGSRVITLIDQFDKVLDLAGITHNSHDDKYTLYSLHYFFAVPSFRRRIGVFDVARNMGTSVQVIQSYYGRQARHAEKAGHAVGWVMRMNATSFRPSARSPGDNPGFS